MLFEGFNTCIENRYIHVLMPTCFYINYKKRYGLGVDKLMISEPHYYR